MIRDQDIECPLFFKLQEFFRRHLQQSEKDAETNAQFFMREVWLPKAEAIPDDATTV